MGKLMCIFTPPFVAQIFCPSVGSIEQVLQFLPSSRDKTWILWISWSKFCPCTSVWQVLTAKTVVVSLLSCSAFIWHCALFHLSSFPFFVENTQTKTLIINPYYQAQNQASTPSSFALPAAPGQVDLVISNTLLLFVFSCPLPWLLSVCPWKEPSHSFFQCSARDPLSYVPVSHIFFLSVLSLGRSPAAIPTLPYSDLTL